MPLLNFKERFAADVESGRKRQTIRAYRKDGRDPKRGDVLYLYTGCRTRGCKKLGEAVCTSGQCFTIRRLPRFLFGGPPDGPHVVEVDGQCKDLRQVRELARRDGFSSVDEFFAFFDNIHGLPFEGQLIRWCKR